MTALKEWYTAAELAGMPGVPSTKRGVNKMSDREEWKHRDRAGRGGGREYHLSALPHETQSHLRHQAAVATVNESIRKERIEQLGREGEAFGAADRARIEAEVMARQQRKETGLAQWAALPDGERKERGEARLWILARLWEYRRAHAGTKSGTRRAFCESINTGDIAVPERVAPHIPRYEARRALTEPTLERWENAYESDGPAGLLDGYGNRKGQSKIATDPERMQIVIGAMLQQPHITPLKVHQYLDAKGLNGMSVKAVERFMSRWKHDNARVWTYMTNPDRWKNVYMPAFGDHFEGITALNQLWELDSTPADWMLIDGRHSVLGAIDLYTRRLKFFVSRTSKAAAVCTLVRRAILDWGVPESVRTDNGQEYVSNQVDEVLRALEIRQDICLPFASEDKGAIERAMRTMLHGILDLLPGFIGHNVAERKVIEARASFAKRVMTAGEVIEVKMSAQELQEKLDQWCEVYHAEPHSGLDDRSPLQMVGAWTKPVRRITDERALDALLMPVGGQRTVTKKGVACDGHDYIAAALTTHIGEEVLLKLDESALGRLYVYSLEGSFICVAEAPDLTGISRAEAAAAATHHARRLIGAQAEELRKHKRSIKENIAEAVLTHKLEEARKLAHFPLRHEEHSTPALDQAAIAARALDAPRAEEATDESRAAREALERELANPPVAQLPETDRQRYQRWVRVSRRSTQEALTDEEHSFLLGYVNSPEWKAQHSVHVDFGLEVDGIAVTDAKEKAPHSAGLNNNVESTL